MPRQKKKVSTVHFGKRLAEIRKMRGLTQKEFGDMIGSSQRMIAHYEKESNPPPSEKLHLIAKTFNITSDELLGIKDIKGNGAPLNKKILKTAKLLDSLPKPDRKAVLHYVDALVRKNGGSKARG